MGWLSGWQYRKSHVINSASGAGTNYQVKIIVHYGSGTDSGADVYLNSHCRTDFGDVRFTDDDGTTLLDYWMESKVDGDYAVFWVEVADDLSSDSVTIYVYYGKSDATTTSNGDNTFLFFDDFSGNLSKWTVRSGTWTIENGELKSTTTSGAQIVRAQNFADVRIRTRFRKTNAANSPQYGVIARSSDASNLYLHQEQRDKTTERTCELWKCVSGTWTKLVDTSRIPDTNYHVTDFLLYGTSLKGYIDGSYELSTTDSQFSTGQVGIRQGDYTTGYYFYVDWFFVAKYVSPEPSHGSWGSEEQAGGQVYEIFVNAASQSLATPAYETTYGIMKDASVASQSLTVSGTTFNIAKDAIVNTLTDMLVEVVKGIIEIFKEAVTMAEAFCQTETAFNISQDTITQTLTQTLFELGIAKDAVVKASTSSIYEVTFTLPLDAVVKTDVLSTLESNFRISQEATIKVLAEVAIIKPTEVKITRLFIVMGDLAIQIQGD